MGDNPTENKRDFSVFRKKLKIPPRAPINDRSYHRWGYRSNETINGRDFTIDEINDIIRSGEIEQIRMLSKYFYRTNSSYRNNIDFLANLFFYDWVVIPQFETGKGSEVQIKKTFYKACEFIEHLDLPNLLRGITTEWLVTGVYNGILRTTNDLVVVQDLPVAYCRTRFKDFNNLNILEFDLKYFDQFKNAEEREEALSTFPISVQKAWAQWKSGKLASSWIPIMPNEGGICFCFVNDLIPMLIGSIPDLKKLDDAVGREEKRDENELRKLLIQRMPIDKEGELVFKLDEVADIHASVAEMLSEIDTVDVLTSFGDTDLENLQENSAATQSADRIAKYKTNAWTSLGRSELLYNATNSSSLAYAIKKDETVMKGYLNIYESWIKYILNEHFSKATLTFDFEILPITRFNQEDYQTVYFRGAQYGYSKMFAGVAMGIKQTSQLSLMTFENDFLEMSTKMIPLQSSYTTSGNVIADEEKKSSETAKKVVKTTNGNNTDNIGGRPELADEDKSEKTVSNIESA